MEYLSDGITGDEINQNIFLIYQNIANFHYSSLPIFQNSTRNKKANNLATDLHNSSTNQ